MDTLSDVLQLLSAHSYITTGQTAGKCWAMRYPGFSGMKFISLRKGHLWFCLEDSGEWRELLPGDGVILTRSAPFILATDPSLSPVRSETVPYVRKNGLADYGGDDSIVLAGKMDIDQIAAEQLFAVLPIVLHLYANSESSTTLNWLMERLHTENESPKPGSALASNHLMYLVMIEGIRSWMLSENAELHGWMGVLRDNRILRAVSSIHAKPEKNWRLIELADISGMSRASFSRRFHEIVGTSPLNYITIWRMHIASKALRLTREPVKQLAFRLGYAAESTFSTVFKRVYGVSPTAHRAAYQDGPVYPLGPYQADTHSF